MARLQQDNARLTRRLTRAEAIIRAADEDDGCCIANVYAGFSWMLLEAPEAPVRAGKYLAAAQRAAPTATRREQLNAEVLRAWVADDLPAALSACERISDEFPRDLTIVKVQQYFEFNRGNSPAMLRAVLKVLERNIDVAYAHGMAAFAYEQCHLLGEAEGAARRALAIKPEYVSARLNRGLTLLLLGDFEHGWAD